MREIILTEELIKELDNILGEIPMKWAAPILQVLEKGLKQKT